MLLFYHLGVIFVWLCPTYLFTSVKIQYVCQLLSWFVLTSDFICYIFYIGSMTSAYYWLLFSLHMAISATVASSTLFTVTILSFACTHCVCVCVHVCCICILHWVSCFQCDLYAYEYWMLTEPACFRLVRCMYLELKYPLKKVQIILTHHKPPPLPSSLLIRKVRTAQIARSPLLNIPLKTFTR